MNSNIYISNAKDFDFDEMLQLATESPLAFYRKRESLIQSALDSFRLKENGRRLQAEIDAACGNEARQAGGQVFFANRLRSITETFDMALNGLIIRSGHSNIGR